jgi:hypothetical protein
MQRARRIRQHLQHVIFLALAGVRLRGVERGISFPARVPLLFNALRYVAKLALLGLVGGNFDFGVGKLCLSFYPLEAAVWAMV